MPLIWIPFVPNFHESLILANRKILADQYEFLETGVSDHFKNRGFGLASYDVADDDETDSTDAEAEAEQAEENEHDDVADTADTDTADAKENHNPQH